MTNADILTEMRGLIEQRSRLMHRAERVMGCEDGMRRSVLDGMPRGTPMRMGAHDIAEAAASLMDEIADIEQELEVYGRKLSPALDRIPEGTVKKMLVRRYWDWNTVDEIATAAGYDRRHVIRVLRRGEEMLKGDSETCPVSRMVGNPRYGRRKV